VQTAKMEALKAHPFAALHVWLPDADVQIRLTARVEIMSGSGVEAQWARVPPASRVSYGTEPAPGTPIDHVYAYEKPSIRARFVVLRCLVDQVDLVHLGARHRRAVFAREQDWVGSWVAP
jgi:pyridoxamine 5'-phosphate oxidase